MPDKVRIGYVPYSVSLDRPGDRRRFVAYANARNLAFELARPEERYDLVVLSEVADVSVWAQYPHGKVVFDLIDSYLAIPRTNLKQWLRGGLWYATGRHRKLRWSLWAAYQDMCRRADAVVCTTQGQQKDIKSYCTNTHIVLDIHSSVVHAVKESYRCGEPFNLVWEGLPSNLSQLKQIRDVLRDIHGRRPLVLNIVTDPDQPRLLGRFGRVHSSDLAREIFDSVRFHIWDEATCSRVIQSCDLAVIPIDLTDPFVVGKPENKLLLLWRMGMPVVTSATPAYQRAMRDVGMDRLACCTQDEWRAALEDMIADESLRRDAGIRGRGFTEVECSKEATLARWDGVFASMGFDFSKKDKIETK
ncbi:glycosyltransferase family 4 protein [Dechloromonas sp. CZR5]|uniref:glycosyltransferase family 4 protein n=1 Tax=Dechloromonas sp. CZR5 TaxID=2608630 RepID=UPI00123E1084|nr:glycosyltransferase family 4 protein [Dechloromonas sp. CZR5]